MVLDPYDPNLPRKDFGTYATTLEEVATKVRKRPSPMGTLGWVLRRAQQSYLRGVGHFNHQGTLVAVYYFNRSHSLMTDSFFLGFWFQDPMDPNHLAI